MRLVQYHEVLGHQQGSLPVGSDDLDTNPLLSPSVCLLPDLPPPTVNTSLPPKPCSDPPPPSAFRQLLRASSSLQWNHLRINVSLMFS